MIPGFLLGRLGRVSEKTVEGITAILTDVAMPCLVFVKLLETDPTLIGWFDLAVCAVFPVVLEILLFFICLPLFKLKGDGEAEVSRFCAIFSNCGFLGIPLAASLFPEEPRAVVLVSVFNVLSTFMLLTLGVYILSGDRKHISVRRAIFKPITAAILLGGVALAFGLNEKLPFLGEYTGYLADLTTPLLMTVLGVLFAKACPKKLFARPSLYLASAVKLIASPLISLLILAVLKFLLRLEISASLAAAIFISSGVSTAATAPAMAQTYQRDAQHATAITILTTLLCMFTLPLLSLLFGLLF